jgi:ABC-type uncharacterized transport system substrate-binding protein
MQGMRGIDKIAADLLRYFVVAMALVVSGCATFNPAQPEPVVHEPVEIIPAPEPTPEPVEIVPDDSKPSPLPPVAIVLTNTQPAYADVARELASYFENPEVYDLSDSSRPPISVLRLINDSNSGAVIAIGLRAAKSSVAMSDRPVVFSQVFNYQDHNLITDHSRGVAAIAPLDAQIKAWKDADPDLSRIGAIVGEGHDELIIEAQRAAERHGIELRVQVTRSDQETLYFFKRMVRDIDGFWLFPDNRVLSRRALQEIMDDAQRNQVAVLVPTETMLQAGASISVSSVASDIAATIAKVIRQIEAGDISKVPPISPLSEIRVTTNDTFQVVER